MQEADYLGRNAQDTRAAPVTGPLQRILERINSAAYNAREIGNHLADHANAVHGSAPEETCASGAKPSGNYGGGLLGEINAALDNLEEALSHNAMQAGRNCTLA